VSPAGNALFAYGSLLFPAVLEAVIGVARSPRPARLTDHARFLVRGEPYPAIVEARGALTVGVVYADLPAEAFVRLDRFEGSFYERRMLEVDSDGGARLAFAYVVPDSRRDLIDEAPFDPAVFERDHLAAWLDSLRARRG
jgi:gamma-glutamylcyclotransferase (GGCT)/AIG2-like uncharacterized protein YtfP